MGLSEILFKTGEKLKKLNDSLVAMNERTRQFERDVDHVRDDLHREASQVHAEMERQRQHTKEELRRLEDQLNEYKEHIAMVLGRIEVLWIAEQRRIAIGESPPTTLPNQCSHAENRKTKQLPESGSTPNDAVRE